jgi:GMP synthase (glutamine-hydrolysing)
MAQDVVVATLAAGPSFSLHRDTWSLPPEGTLVGRTTGFNHAFRLGSALGVQSHPELTFDTLASWLSTTGGTEVAASVGTDTVTLLNDFGEVADRCRDVADRFFEAWFDEVRTTIASGRALPTLSP